MGTVEGGTNASDGCVCEFAGKLHRMVRLLHLRTASALVFNSIFFPSFDPLVGTLLAFGTFAAGAIMRPLGGIVCGHYGDRIGRKSCSSGH